MEDYRPGINSFLDAIDPVASLPPAFGNGSSFLDSGMHS
jgi:hypothetical protein